MILVKLIPKKKGGKKWKVPAVFFEKDGWLEAKPPKCYPMSAFLKKADLPLFLAGKKVDFSYTYFVQKVD